MQDALDRLDVPKVVKCTNIHTFSPLEERCQLYLRTTASPLAVILSLQQPSGVFAGDSFGEIDTRFSYCAVSALSLLGRLHELDIEKTTNYIIQCRNFDGGFGSCVGAESHAGQGNINLDASVVSGRK